MSDPAGPKMIGVNAVSKGERKRGRESPQSSHEVILF